ncbi:MAG: 3'-5' exonuclease [Bacteroidetes bacterium]|nr:3'-5' exonuclease [Bacteroidota bacterium]
MELNLRNPIAFFDLETTGINVASDRIVEISVLKVDPSSNEELLTQRINPTIPISKEALAIHGISNDDVSDKPTFAEFARKLANFLEGCDFAGYNCNKFDIPLLAEEFLRVDLDFDFKKHKVIDVQVIFHKMEQRTLSAAYKFYCNKKLENAHSAEADIIATYEVLKAQLDFYSNLKNDVDYLSKFSSHKKTVDLIGRIVYNQKGEEVFNFGKHKGEKVEDVFNKEPSYYNWIMNGDFPLFTKKVLTEIKLRPINSK